MTEFILTLASDDEVENSSSSSDEDEKVSRSTSRRKTKFSKSFRFDTSEYNDDDYDDDEDNFKNYGVKEIQQSWDFDKAIETIKKNEHPAQKNTTSLDEKIRNKLLEKEKQKLENPQVEIEVKRHDQEIPAIIKPSTKESKSKQQPKQQQETETFTQLNLSRPIIRAIQTLGFERPTPIQSKTIPYALQGKDICGSAVTGSGKTAAYLLPVLERLLYRPIRIAATRVLIITPTRELAQQVLSMQEKLSQFIPNLTSICIVGGLSMIEQSTMLRGRPDIVIGTPGRLIDHLHNTQGVDFDNIEILILDEADRLLELGFCDELNELIKYTPINRQTLLFSATLTNQVSNLVDITLKSPIRIAADPLFDMAQRLQQEFIRIRSSKENDREAILLSLCTRTFLSETIIFFKKKVTTHRISILFGLCKLKVAELHGNLTQRQRLEALQKFRDKKVDFLLCTDLAARGLDIQGVKAVINYEMPRDMTTYVHRVGRTARAGHGGKSITLTGENRRLIMKEVLKRSKQNVKSRQVNQNIIDSCREQIEMLEQDIHDILKEEQIEKEARIAEMEACRAGNIIQYQDEIMSRPSKTWFQSDKQKQAIREASKQQYLNNDDDNNKKEEKKKKNIDEKKIKKPHRLTRAKRRRIELRKREEIDKKQSIRELNQEAKQVGDIVDHDKVKQLKVTNEQKQKTAAKLSKRKQRDEIDQRGTLAPAEITSLKQKKQKIATKTTRSSIFNVDLDTNQVISGSGGDNYIDNRFSKSKKYKNSDAGKEVFKERTFKGGLRHGGKLGNKKFKSKARFKRR